MTHETLKELATGRTKTGDVAGSATSSTALEPTIFLREIVDAAKASWFFMDVCHVTDVGKGNADVVIPKRSKYLASSGITYATATPNAGSPITSTKIDNLDGVTLTPSVQASRVSIGNYALRVNSLNLMRAAQDELTYSIGDKIDAIIATTIGDALSSTSALAGAQILYGGDATSDNTLATGDVLTTDLVAQAKKLMMSVNKQFRATAAGNGGGFGAVQTATIAGNPWMPTASEPFVFFIGTAQWQALATDSQFVNAAEYGNNEVVLNGEIGKYLGIKVVVTTNVESIASGSEGPDEETANAGANMTRCILVKSKRACAFAWGLKPEITVWNNVPEISKEIVLESAYQAKVLHPDAIVFVDVTDA